MHTSKEFALDKKYQSYVYLEKMAVNQFSNITAEVRNSVFLVCLQPGT